MSSAEPLREPIEPPGGFEQSPRPAEPAHRPDWLMGADDNAEFARPDDRPRPTLSRPHADETPVEKSRPAFRLEKPLARQPQPEPEPEPRPEEPSSGWSAAASSVPRLPVSSRGESRSFDEEEEQGDSPDLDLEGELRDDDRTGEEGEPGQVGEQTVDLPHEPWWLVAGETLATNRPIQIGIAAVLVAVAAWVLWPRKENQTTAIAAIKTHPERFEGQPVRVRGTVGEVFDVGSGVVFHLVQRRDTMVVFSPNRRPTPRDRLVILGTVSTGYLDGAPRVALFESATTPEPR